MKKASGFECRAPRNGRRTRFLLDDARGIDDSRENPTRLQRIFEFSDRTVKLVK